MHPQVLPGAFLYLKICLFLLLYTKTLTISVHLQEPLNEFLVSSQCFSLHCRGFNMPFLVTPSSGTSMGRSMPHQRSTANI